MTFDDLTRTLRELATKRVVVGVTAETDPRPDGRIGNAALGYIIETGSALTNTPHQPFLVPGVEAAQQQIERHLREAADAALESRSPDAGLAKAGTASVDEVRRRMPVDTGELRESITSVIRET